LFENFLHRSSVHPVRTMPKSVSKSSSSLDAVIISGHLADSSHQETLYIKSYLQDMVVHRFVDVGRDVNGVHRSGMSC
jgi:hypothetical protein